MNTKTLANHFFSERSFSLPTKAFIFFSSCAAFLLLNYAHQTSHDEGRLFLYVLYLIVFSVTFFSGFIPGIIFAVLSSSFAVKVFVPEIREIVNVSIAEMELFPFIAVYFLIVITVDWFRQNIETLRKQLAENEELHAQTRRIEKLALAGEIAAGITHEIRNPLTVIHGYVQLLEKKCPKESGSEEIFKLILEEIKRTNQIITDFLRFSRPDTPKKEYVQLNEVLETVSSLISGEGMRKDVDICFYPTLDIPPLYLDRNQFIQVFLNLFNNAVQAMPNGGTLSVSTLWDKNKKTAIIHINDSGTGISPEVMEKLFTPFFTTKESGTGLGLGICQNIILAHKGVIGVESVLGQGTRFTIELPAPDTSPD